MSELDRARKIATVALHRAIAGDMPTAARYLRRLNGSTGLLLAIQAFCDTYIGELHPDHAYGAPLRLVWFDVDGAGDVDADAVSPPLRWAGRVIAARAAMDLDGYTTLLNAPSAGAELGDSIMALLNIVATSIRDIDLVQTKQRELEER